MKTDEYRINTEPQTGHEEERHTKKDENWRYDPVRLKYLAQYQNETDEQLCQRLRDITAELGRPPSKAEVPACDYIKKRLGPWPRALERAGVKLVSEHRRMKLEHRTHVRHVKRLKGKLKKANRQSDQKMSEPF